MTRIPNLKNLLFLSSYLTNRIDYLQGAGGNISEKIDGDVMAIKSSGLEIKQMNQKYGYSLVNYKKISDRLTKNFHNCGCGAPQVESLAYAQPELQFNDGYGFTSMNGCNIDEDSKAKIGKDKLTNKREIHFLNHRPHATTPFLSVSKSSNVIVTFLPIVSKPTL